MAGNRLFKVELQVLRHLAQGPSNKTEIKRALGWDVTSANKAIDGILASMREAGLIEPAAKGEWQIAAELCLCPTCHGRGVVDKLRSSDQAVAVHVVEVMRATNDPDR